MRSNWKKRNFLRQTTLLPNLDIVAEEKLSDNSFDCSDSERSKSAEAKKEELGQKLTDLNTTSMLEVKRQKTKIIEDIIRLPKKQKTIKETQQLFRENQTKTYNSLDQI